MSGLRYIRCVCQQQYCQRKRGRLRQSDEDLEADFVTTFGRLSDGSSPAKLPGISIDNSAYNTIVNNNVTQNYGSGVKMVRSAYRNIIMENSVSDNKKEKVMISISLELNRT